MMADPELEDLQQSIRDTEDELLKGAFEPQAKEPEAEAPKEGRARDPETGRFTKAEPAAAESKPAADEQPVDKPQGEPAERPDEQVPSWRLREINEEKRRAQQELETMRVEHARMQAYLAQLQRAQQPAAPATPPPDPLVDPNAYNAYQDRRAEEREQRLLQQMAHERLNMNLEMTHMRHGERFEKAYEALVTEGQRGNQQLVQQLVRQANPGEAI